MHDGTVGLELKPIDIELVEKRLWLAELVAVTQEGLSNWCIGVNSKWRSGKDGQILLLLLLMQLNGVGWQANLR